MIYRLPIRRGLFLLLFAAIRMAAPGQGFAQIETRPFVHNEYSRPYLIYRPPHLPAHPAVVFMLGGIRSTAKSASEDFNWTSEADRHGFLVVFPDPVATHPDHPPHQPLERHD